VSRVQIGTDRYMYPFVPKPKKVQIGTTPFRVYLLYLGYYKLQGVISMNKSFSGATDLFGIEISTKLITPIPVKTTEKQL
jgi:hypothetical protein